MGVLVTLKTVCKFVTGDVAWLVAQRAYIYVGLMRATTHPHGAQTLDVGHQLLHGDGRARMHFGAALHGQVATADETDFFVQGFKLQHELRIVHLSQMHGGDVYNNNNNNNKIMTKKRQK